MKVSLIKNASTSAVTLETASRLQELLKSDDVEQMRLVLDMEYQRLKQRYDTTLISSSPFDSGDVFGSVFSDVLYREARGKLDYFDKLFLLEKEANDMNSPAAKLLRSFRLHKYGQGIPLRYYITGC